MCACVLTLILIHSGIFNGIIIRDIIDDQLHYLRKTNQYNDINIKNNLMSEV